MRLQLLYRIGLITFSEFALGPRSPFVGTSGGAALVLGLAFEASRLGKLLARQLGVPG